MRFFATKVVAPRASVAASTPQVPLGMNINPYAMFIKENFKANTSDMKRTDLMKELSGKWKALSISEKDVIINIVSKTRIINYIYCRSTQNSRKITMLKSWMTS